MATKPKFDPAMFAAVKADAAKAEAKRQAAAPKPPRVPVLTPKPPKAVVVPPVAVKPVTAILPLTPTLARQELTAIFVAARCTRRGAEELVARMTDRQAMKLAADARKAKTHA